MSDHDPSLPFGGRWRWLAHPGFIACVAVLALNDHVLKGRFPGWWTGKLSDVAGIAVVAVLVSVLFGSRRAIPFVGFGFVLLKTIPGVAEAARPFLGGVTARDASDLVALAVLWPLWHLMRGPQGDGDHAPAPMTAPRDSEGLRQRRRIGLGGWLPLASTIFAVATATATSCVPNQEVTAVGAYEGTMYATIDEGYGDLLWASSGDGGRSWERTETAPASMNTPEPHGPTKRCATDGTCWRVRDQRVIERRPPEGGWVEEFRLSESEFDGISTGCLGSHSAILTSVAIAEDASGPHVVANLGADGVVVRQSDGRWLPTAVMSAPPTPATPAEETASRFLLLWPILPIAVLLVERKRWPSWRAGLSTVLVGWIITIMVAGFWSMATARTIEPAAAGARVEFAGLVVTTVAAIAVARSRRWAHWDSLTRSVRRVPPRPDIRRGPSMKDGSGWMRTQTHVNVICVIGIATILLGSMIVLGGMDYSGTDPQVIPGEWIAWLIMPIGGVVMLVRGLMAGVRTDASGVYVRNYWKTYFYPWSEVQRFYLRPAGAMLVGGVSLSSGLERPIVGIRTTATKDQEPLVHRLNAELARHRGGTASLPEPPPTGSA